MGVSTPVYNILYVTYSTFVGTKVTFNFAIKCQFEDYPYFYQVRRSQHMV
jgi:hypothetical protein